VVQIIRDVKSLRDAIFQLRQNDARIALVPTMGALHAGHAALVEAARRTCDVVVVSCFVNPTQFQPHEDLDRYPRTPERDHEVATRAGADLLWRPRTADVYRGGSAGSTRVVVGDIGTVLEGRARPGHFDGVATVVVRLLAAVAPDELFLGVKDYQQLVVLRRVVDDLLLPVQVRAVPTEREPDGIARSSRNAYLDGDGRDAARTIPRALVAARAAILQGARDAAAILGAASAVLTDEDRIDVDYLALVDGEGLAPIERLDGRDAVLLVAARVGSTRLIDNLPIPADAPPDPIEVRP